MLHKFINTLNNQFSYNQWLFLLTCYELSKGKWIRRRDIYDVVSINSHSTNVSSMMQRLLRLGMIEQEKRVTGTVERECFVKLTKEAKDILVGAFKAMSA